MDYDSITGRLALYAAGMVAAKGPRRAEGSDQGSRSGGDFPREATGLPRRGVGMAESGNRALGLGVAQLKAGHMDAGTRRPHGSGVERLSAVKRQDMIFLFVLTALFWAAVFGGEFVLEFMRGNK